MKKQLLSFFTFFALLTGFMTSNAQPWAWKAYKKTLPDGNEQTIFVEFDFHITTNYSNTQKKDFIETVKKFGNKSLVLVEDYAMYDGTNPFFKSQSNFRFFFEIYRNFIVGLTKQCRENGINAQSIEFRRTTAINTEITNLDFKTYLFFVLHGQLFNLRTMARYQPTIQDWQQNFNETKNDVITPITSVDLNTPHRDSLQQVILEKATIFAEDQQKFDVILKHFQNDQQKFTNLVCKKDIDENLTFLKELEGSFIELLALKRIAQNTDKQAIFVCMGGEHSENLCTMLEKTGYSKIGEVAIPKTSDSMIQERSKGIAAFHQVILRHGDLVKENPLYLSQFINELQINRKLNLSPSFSSITIIKQPNFWISPDTIQKCLIGSAIAGSAMGYVGIIVLVYKLHQHSLLRSK